MGRKSPSVMSLCDSLSELQCSDKNKLTVVTAHGYISLNTGINTLLAIVVDLVGLVTRYVVISLFAFIKYIEPSLITYLHHGNFFVAKSGTDFVIKLNATELELCNVCLGGYYSKCHFSVYNSTRVIYILCPLTFCRAFLSSSLWLLTIWFLFVQANHWSFESYSHIHPIEVIAGWSYGRGN